MKKFFQFVVSVGLLFIACKDKKTAETKPQSSTPDSSHAVISSKDSPTRQESKTEANTDSSVAAFFRRDSILLKSTQDILKAIKNKNYRVFANYIDPVYGVRFSPYGHIDTIRHIRLTRAKFLEQVRKSEQDKLVWGKYDATDQEILMTLDKYLQRFVYDVDFLKPENRSVNKFLGSGNTLNNLLAVYKNCDFTESHFSGFDSKYGGMDWRSLRLVFKERKGKYLLVGIVHDEWTI